MNNKNKGKNRRKVKKKINKMLVFLKERYELSRKTLLLEFSNINLLYAAYRKKTMEVKI